MDVPNTYTYITRCNRHNLRISLQKPQLIYFYTHGCNDRKEMVERKEKLRIKYIKIIKIKCRE